MRDLPSTLCVSCIPTKSCVARSVLACLSLWLCRLQPWANSAWEFQVQPRKSPVKGMLAGGSALGGWGTEPWPSWDVVGVVEDDASSSFSEGDEDEDEEEGSEGPVS